MPSLYDEIIKVSKANPGMILVILGVMIIYFVASASALNELTTISLLAVIFGFFISAAGVILLFKQMGAVGEQMRDIPTDMYSSDIEAAAQQLGRNYNIQRQQATQGFILAGVLMTLGVLVILAGALGELFGFAAAASNLTVVAGVVIEGVSGLGLYIFKQTSTRLSLTTDRLHELWKILAAFRQAETLPEVDRIEIQKRLLQQLVNT